MRSFPLPDGSNCSALGFGCGAVMGRVGKPASLLAMEEAFSQGINLFDTARSYGMGQAEAVLGEFLRGKRSQAIVSTKFGISADAINPGWKAFLLPAARMAARNIPALRRALRKRPEHQVTAAPLTPGHMRSSLELSLKHLRTDYVDFLFLHDAPAPVMLRDDLFAAMEELRQEGKVRWYGVSSSVEAGQAMLDAQPGAQAVQMPANIFNLPLAADAAAKAKSAERGAAAVFLANHTFGGTDSSSFTRQRLRQLTFNPRLPAEVRAKLPDGRNALLPGVMLPLVLRKVGADAAIVSMMVPANVRANVRAVDQDPWSQPDLDHLFDILAHPFDR